jgi:hypothetical protein
MQLFFSASICQSKPAFVRVNQHTYACYRTVYTLQGIKWEGKEWLPIVAVLGK